MIKSSVFVLILFLVISTSLVKNSTKDVEDQIYSIQENILFLENRFKDSKLEFDYLSSSEKLLEFQKLYFENSLLKKSIQDLKILKFSEDQVTINDLKFQEINE
jgi:uncharacterized membrane protein YgaE (UPF0421/DUF939 family)|tara:strand:+ start:747 stop:1058 length:312 start_codon:yes stop_codon:yes gene_type:complete